MVVLAASICTKSGKALVSRQFMDMPRTRIEGLLASFPKLLSSKDQHTFVETDSVRYVYKPLEELFMVLITNKHSNILQDIDTLHLFARVVSDHCKTLDEREVSRRAFELLAVFDEIVSLGYRESITMAQIKTIIEMESQEERVQAEIARQKEKEAKEELNRKMRMLELQKREAAKRGYSAGSSMSGFGSGSSGPAYGGGSGYGMGSTNTNSGMSSQSASSGGFGNTEVSTGFGSTSSRLSNSGFTSSPAPSAAPSKGRGMQLGRKKSNAAAMAETVRTEEGIVAPPPGPRISQAAAVMRSSPIAAHVSSSNESVEIVMDEKIVLKANKDGGLQGMEVKGELMLKINDPEQAYLKISTSSNNDPNLQMKTHPNVNKQQFSTDGTITLKDTSRPFPTGQPLGVLKWRYVTKDENEIPLAINCWPTPTGSGTCEVNIEYELQKSHLELTQVVISIPIPGNAPPTVSQVDGLTRIDRQKRCLDWEISSISSSNSSGTLEFVSSSDDVDGFFPIRVHFVCSDNLCDVKLLQIADVNSGAPVKFGLQKQLSPEEYVVV